MRHSTVLLCLAAGALAAGKPLQKPMPVEAGVLPGQKVIQVRLEQGSAHLPDADVRAALAGATRAWNAALPADLKLVETPMSQPLPAGEVVFLVRFDSDPSHFGKGGIDEIGDIRGIIDRRKNHALVALFLVDKPGVLHTNGAAAAHDLQLVMKPPKAVPAPPRPPAPRPAPPAMPAPPPPASAPAAAPPAVPPAPAKDSVPVAAPPRRPGNSFAGAAE